MYKTDLQVGDVWLNTSGTNQKRIHGSVRPHDIWKY